MGVRRLVQLAALLVAIAALVAVFFMPLDSESYASDGYSGIFTFALVTGVFPAPTTVVIFLAGNRLHPVGIALAGGLGSALGEASSYLVGYGSLALIGKGNQWLERLRHWRPVHWFEQNIASWMAAHPALTIFLVSLIPNPVIDITGMVAGRAAYSLPRYLLATALGKIGRFLLVAWLGGLWLE